MTTIMTALHTMSDAKTEAEGKLSHSSLCDVQYSIVGPLQLATQFLMLGRQAGRQAFTDRMTALTLDASHIFTVYFAHIFLGLYA